MLKKAVQQGRRRSKNQRRTLLGYVEDSCELRTPPGGKRVSAHRGWEGEKTDFFSILLGRWRQHRYDAERAAGTAGDFHRQSDHVESPMWKIV
jgi:hypothetical protein